MKYKCISIPFHSILCECKWNRSCYFVILMIISQAFRVDCKLYTNKHQHAHTYLFTTCICNEWQWWSITEWTILFVFRLHPLRTERKTQTNIYSNCIFMAPFYFFFYVNCESFCILFIFFYFVFFSVSWYSIPFRFMKIRMIFAPFYSLVLIFEIHELLCWHQIKFILQIAQS